MTRPTTEPTTALERARELLRRATPGPWRAAKRSGKPGGVEVRSNGLDIAYVYRESERSLANAELIALAVNLLPALLEVAEAAQVVLDKQRHDVPGNRAPLMRAHDALLSALARLEEVQP